MDSRVVYENMTFAKMIDSEEIESKIAVLASDINREYFGQKIEVIIVLKGAFIFAADLVRHFNFDHRIHFIQFSSYQGTVSSGLITEKFPLDLDVKNKKILIIEDIVDTGNTLNYFIQKLGSDAPLSIDIAALLFKTEAYSHNYPVKFSAFQIENKFVIGYGLDLNEQARNLPHIYQLDK
ncbi:MAG: hypoxanthine phosphoribosyltransferase [Deltaproteobacteria bacterium]